MNLQKKSRTTAVALALLLGPIGLMYVSVIGGLILLVIAVMTLPTVIGPIACWVIAIAWADHKAHHNNKAIDDFMEAVKAGK